MADEKKTDGADPNTLLTLVVFICITLYCLFDTYRGLEAINKADGEIGFVTFLRLAFDVAIFLFCVYKFSQWLKAKRLNSKQ